MADGYVSTLPALIKRRSVDHVAIHLPRSVWIDPERFWCVLFASCAAARSWGKARIASRLVGALRTSSWASIRLHTRKHKVWLFTWIAEMPRTLIGILCQITQVAEVGG